MDQGTGFIWDDRSSQPEQLGDRRSNFLSVLRDIFPMTALAATNVLHVLPLLFRYRYYRKHDQFFRIRPESVGCSVSYDEDNRDELIQAFNESGAGSLLVRILVWEENRYRDICEFVKSFGLDRERVVITAVQDRKSVTDTALWTNRLGRIIDMFSPCAEYFQIGHVPNRKKWGFRHTGEYVRLCRASRSLRTGDIQFIGPSSIDFELQYTDAILARTGRNHLDVFNSLLYVDRRGAPELPQWPSFDTMNKIRITRALGDINGMKDKPFWITEVNWPLENTGRFSPAARSVCVSEETYADYLARYYLLAFATGIPQRIFWWELCARGYGLIDPGDGGLRKRPGFSSFSTIARILPGCENAGICRNNEIFITRFTRENESLFALWSTEGVKTVDLQSAPQTVQNLSGETAECSSSVAITSSPVFLTFKGDVSIEETFVI